jgi:hypothetical protein
MDYRLSVDVTTMVTPCTRVHILHGGKTDVFGIRQAVSHLQSAWCMPAVLCRNRSHLQELAETVSRVPPGTHFIVCVPFDVVAHAPDAYDRLCAHDTITVLITVPVSSLGGAPYARASDILVITIPSARIDMDNLQNVKDVYRFPKPACCSALDIGPGVDNDDDANTTADVDVDVDASADLDLDLAYDLDSMAWSLPHEYGIAWRVGRSLFRPAIVDFSNPVISNARRLADAQTAVDRAWWWSRDTGIAHTLLKLPDVIAGITIAANAPFTAVCNTDIRRISDDTLAFATSMTKDELFTLRSTCSTVCKCYDAHVLSADDACTPVRFALQNTFEHERNGVLTLTCRVTFPVTTPVATLTDGHERRRKTWKPYVGKL